MSESPKAGPELDALVAEFVMGWRHCQDDLTNEMWDTGIHLNHDPEMPTMKWPNCGPRRWSPSTSIADAWEVVEKLLGDDWECTIDRHKPNYVTACRGAYAFFWHSAEQVEGFTRRGGKFGVEADTAPLAICLAALKAVGHPTDE